MTLVGEFNSQGYNVYVQETDETVWNNGNGRQGSPLVFPPGYAAGVDTVGLWCERKGRALSRARNEDWLGAYVMTEESQGDRWRGLDAITMGVYAPDAGED